MLDHFMKTICKGIFVIMAYLKRCQFFAIFNLHEFETKLFKIMIMRTSKYFVLNCTK